MTTRLTIPKQTVAQYLAEKIDASCLTQAEISRLCGFKRPQMVSMLRYGRVALPFDRIVPLARALGVDEHELAVLAVSEYEPELFEILSKRAALITSS